MNTRNIHRRLLLAAAAPALASCGAVDLLNAMVPTEGYERTSDIAYGEGPRRKLDVYRPRAASASPLPVVVFFYGGSWTSGERDEYTFVGEALTAMGYVAVVPDYRLHPEGLFPGFVEDAAAAVKWTAAEIAKHGGDPQKIVVMGHSAGAHVGILATLDRTFGAAGVVKGFVGLAGPYSFDPMEWRATRKVFQHLKDSNAARPVTYVTPQAPPMLLLHGADDTSVGPYNSEDLDTALTKAGVPHKYVVYPDMGHVGMILALSAPFRKQQVIDEISGFISKLGSNPNFTT